MAKQPRPSGFTFIEVMVVGVIVAVLAAVAIPAYNGYVRNQRQAMVASLAQTASVSASAYYRRNGTPPPGHPGTQAALKLFLPGTGSFRVDINGNDVVVQEGTGSRMVEARAPFR
jgi:prepilin-type N-terminal cleavage/methylation domain-containing protein